MNTSVGGLQRVIELH